MRHLIGSTLSTCGQQQSNLTQCKIGQFVGILLLKINSADSDYI